jgi:hypothetical protein
MLIIIINKEIAEKLRSIEFPKGNRLDPVQGNIDGVDLEWLPANLKDCEYFKEVLQDFEACDSKEIDTIEQKFYDPLTDVEILPTKIINQVISSKQVVTIVEGKEVIEKVDEVVYEEEKTVYLGKAGAELNIFEMKSRTILIPVTVEEIKEEGIISKTITKVVDGIVWVYDSIIGWFKS